MATKLHAFVEQTMANTTVVTPLTRTRLSNRGAHHLAVALWVMERGIIEQERIQKLMNYQLGGLDIPRTMPGYKPPVVESRESRLQRHADFLNSLARRIGIEKNERNPNGYEATIQSLTSSPNTASHAATAVGR